MLFSSLIFLICFLPIVLFLYYIVCRKSRKAQNILLLIASLGFYAWGEPWFVFVMIGSIIGNWIFGLLVDRYRESRKASRWIIVLMLVFNLTIIFIFKYLMFALTNINLLFKGSFAVPEIMLPIGISFFTFQAISYVIDVYRKTGEVQKNLLNVGLYISFFPQLIAGPIVRYQTICDQIMNRRESFEDFSAGVCRFMMGFSKKVLLANNFAVIADQAFAMSQNDNCSVGFAWLGAIAYTLQIYFDFSGYSDMAIGLGKMFGFHFSENFNYPYISKSVSEFWRRWHISLGSWFRDYVYFPLGGSRVSSNGRLAFNLFVVWLLTGIWHGANWTFIVWGLMYFVFITIEKFSGMEKKPAMQTKAAVGLRHIYTMLLVVIGWVIFRANTIGDAGAYISTMFGGGDAPLTDANFIVYMQENKVFLVFGILLSLPVAKWLAKALDRRGLGDNPLVTIVYVIVMLALFGLSMAYLVKGAYNPFIYFNF